MDNFQISSFGAKLKLFFRRIGWFAVSAFFGLMTIQSSGFASFNKLEYNIIITPDHFPIIWPKDDGAGEMVTYGNPDRLTAAELLDTFVCLSSANCTVDAINAGAVYYKVIDIAGVGEVVFFYDELGNLVGTQKKAELAYVDPNQQTGYDQIPLEINDNTETPGQYFGNYDQYAVGATSASFNVDPSGSSNYEIPIFTPPGINDLQPSLSINYNSQSGNGLLGIGFNISGLSSIARCPKTRAQDGIVQVAAPPKFTSDDAYCMDGQRLILVSGNSGEAGAVYRTERDNFSRVTVITADTYGPLSFEVKTKAGQTFKYGTTVDSRIFMRGHDDAAENAKKITMTWAIETIQDVAPANTIDFSYYNTDEPNTGFRVKQISYGVTGSKALVAFNYDNTRPDVKTGYLNGYVVTTPAERLVSINVSIEGSQARSYYFDYEQNHVGKSRLTELMECGNLDTPNTVEIGKPSEGNTSHCFLPVAFDWSEGPTGISTRYLSNQLANWRDNTDRYHISDLDGDGQTDFLMGPDSGGGWYLVEGRDDDQRLHYNAAAPLSIAGGWHDNLGRIRSMDMDGDGTQEIILGPTHSGGGNWYAIKRKPERDGDKTKLAAAAHVGTGFDSWASLSHLIRPFDVNGDGKQDILLGPKAGGEWRAMVSNGNSFYPIKNYILSGIAGVSADHLKFSDVNGDGLQDILVGPVAGAFHLLRNTGTGFTTELNYIPSNPIYTGSYNAKSIRAVDVTGDGLDDIVVGPRLDNVWHVSVNTGAGFKEPTSWGTGYSSQHDNQDRIHILDVDVDGFTDYVMGPVSNGDWFWMRSNGNDGFTNEGVLLNAYPYYDNRPERIHLGDINGDGLTEIVLNADKNGGWKSIGPNAEPGDKLITITNGTTPKTTIDYQALSKDADSIYTRNDVDSKTLPMYAVKSVSKGNGVGGQNSTSYQYQDLKFDLDGRGAKGFKTVEIADSATDTVTTTTYSQTFPTVGMPLEVTQKIGDKNGSYHLISKTINEYDDIQTATAAIAGTSNPLYVVNKLSTEYSYEYGGGSDPIAYKTMVTETGYDGDVVKVDNFGNIERVKVTATGLDGQSFSKTTESTYKATNQTNWVLGRLETATVTHANPDGINNMTRKSSFTYKANGQLLSETIEPDSANTKLSKTSTYQYDTYGLRSRVDEEGFHHNNDPMANRFAKTTTTIEPLDGKSALKTVVENSIYESETTWSSLLHGGVLKHIGPNGKETLTEYDEMGRVIKTIDHLDVKAATKYEWTKQSPLRSVYKITKSTEGIEGSPIEAIMNEQTVFYDELNREIRTQNRILDGRFAIKETYYNAKGLVEKANRPYLSYSTPVWICFEYDAMGRVIEENLPGANNGSPNCNGANRATSNTTYNGLIRDHTNALGHESRETRNVMDKVVRVDEALNDTVIHSWLEYEYDAMQNLTGITDANGKKTTIVYDANGRKKSMQDPAMGVWQYFYNSYGELEKQIDAKVPAQVVMMEYDKLGRMIKRIDGEGPWEWIYGTDTDTTINDIGKLVKETGPDGYERSYVYNANLQLEKSILKQRVNITDPNSVETLETSFTYDVYGRAQTTEYPGGFKTTKEYNRYGHLVAVNSPAQALTSDAIAKLQIKKADLLNKANAAETQATTYLNQALEYQAKAVKYEVYAVGLLSMESRDESVTVTREKLLNAADRLRNISLVLLDEARKAKNDALASAAQASSLENSIINGTSSEVYNSHRFAAQDHAKDARFKLDKARAIVREIKAQAETQEFSFQYANTSIALNQAETYLNLAFEDTAAFQDQQALADRYYRLAQNINSDIANNSSPDGPLTWWRAGEADVEGRITKSVYGNGTATERVYDPNTGHLLEISTGDGVVELHKLSYEYDHLNNVKKRADHSLNYNEGFDYDALDRLQTATLHAGTLNAGRSWTHDKTGNITAVDGNAYNYENHTEPGLADKLLNTPNQTANFSYDANGNIISSGGRTYEYTSFNKPNSLSDGTTKALFTYGADKSRIKKVNLESEVVTKTTIYHGAYQKIISPSGEIEHKYHISAGGSLIAVHRTFEGSTSAAPVSNYLHKDALGSVTLITDANGDKVGDIMAYTPFGVRRNTTALADFVNSTWLTLPSFDPVITKRGFTGHEHIDELDLIHMNGRVYDPYIGHFLSPDPNIQMPKSTQGFNRYAYVQNNPLKYTDPSGYFIKALSKVFSGFMKKYGRTLISLAITAYSGLPPFWAGFAGGFVASGGDFKAALIGGASAYLANQIGHGVFEGGGDFWTAIKHGIAQGTTSALAGGRFKDGFLGGFIGHAVATVLPMPPGLEAMGDTPGGVAARTAYAAMAGGIAAKLGGGKFENGAVSAAFTHLFNAELHAIESDKHLYAKLNSEHSRISKMSLDAFVDEFKGYRFGIADDITPPEAMIIKSDLEASLFPFTEKYAMSIAGSAESISYGIGGSIMSKASKYIGMVKKFFGPVDLAIKFNHDRGKWDMTYVCNPRTECAPVAWKNND